MALLTQKRLRTQAGNDPMLAVAWERRDARIVDTTGRDVFVQTGVEVPRAWSLLATHVVASKYFRGAPGSPQREHSVKQLVGRVVQTVRGWATGAAVLATGEDVQAFADELTALLLHQMAAFNSPVWFNVGVEAHPQCSACFINRIDDTLDSILELVKTEGRLFKHGSGTGTNMSPLRGSREGLSAGGTASGPVRFMRGYDAFAGVIKSGGKTRRAAKMVILDVDHPDIIDFIDCKAKEEKKAWALMDAGYDGAVDGEAYNSVFFQNSNHSVRVPDAFMQAAVNNEVWHTRNRLDKAVAGTYQAGDILRQISQSAHLCGDPGMQFHTTINSWHTCPASGPIHGSNPCSEYMFLDDSACNLASLNLLQFCSADGAFAPSAFEHAVRLMVLAQEIIVDAASYPTPQIAENSRRFRPLGLGYANLGALLMARGLAYDSEAARAFAAAITALMTGVAYARSAELAAARGPFAGYHDNAAGMQQVIQRHHAAAQALAHPSVPPDLAQAVRLAWDETLTLGRRHGFRNAQVSALAPTGTIAFMMDCDTTGVEPELALVKEKRLVGGGVLRLVNRTVDAALQRLGYAPAQRQAMLAYVQQEGTLEGAPFLRPEDAPIFDCAFAAGAGGRRIAPAGHVLMMAAVQPFVSGAISKTVNLPTDATAEAIADIYTMAWRLGLKSIAVYRDGCKRSQPLSAMRRPSGHAPETDAPPCHQCGTPMLRSGPCFRCGNCGTSSACS